MGKHPECALYYSPHRETVRMVAECEMPTVVSEIETCDHLLVERQTPKIDVTNVTDVCRRAVACRNAKPIESSGE